LDLKGGIHLVLQVMTDDALNGETDQEIIRFTDLFKKNSIRFTTAAKEKPGRFVFTGLDVDQQIKARDLVAQYTRDWDASFMADRVTFTLKASAVTFLKDQAVVQTVETIRNRIDQFGVSEPLIQRQGENQIVVELPGVDDPERVKDLIKVTAVLEWKLVKAGPAEDEATLLQSFGGTVPDDAEIVRGDPARGHPGVYLVEKVATVSGKDLRMVRRGTDEWGNPAVSFTLSSDGGRRFEQVTGANIGRALAIILDDRVQLRPQHQRPNRRFGDHPGTIHDPAGRRPRRRPQGRGAPGRHQVPRGTDDRPGPRLGFHPPGDGRRLGGHPPGHDLHGRLLPALGCQRGDRDDPERHHPLRRSGLF
jgi:Preprotein translocase subunit SecD